MADAAGIRFRSWRSKFQGNGRQPKSPLRRLNLLTAGTPCQPASCAGKRRGKEDDRWLWHELFRVIALFRPDWVIAENVTGLAGLVEFESALEVDGKRHSREEMAAGSADVGRVCERVGRGVLDQILEDIESLGYDVAPPLVIPAVAVDAPHRRDRVWIIAHSKHDARGAEWGIESWPGEAKGPSQNAMPVGSGETVGNSPRIGWDEGKTERSGGDQGSEGTSGGSGGALANSECAKRRQNHEAGRHSCERENREGQTAGGLGESGQVIPDTNSARLQKQRGPIADGEEHKATERSGWWEFESCLGGVADGLSRRLDGNPCLWSPEPPHIPRVAHGVKNRVPRLKGLGNSVVPYIPEIIMRAIYQLIIWRAE